MAEERMTCQSLVELATEWTDGALPLGQRLALELHLATCAGCLAYVEQLRQATAVVADLDAEPPEEPVRAQLLDMFRQANPSSSSAGSEE